MLDLFLRAGAAVALLAGASLMFALITIVCLVAAVFAGPVIIGLAALRGLGKLMTARRLARELRKRGVGSVRPAQ